MEPNQGRIQGLGVQQEVTPTRQRYTEDALDAAVAYAVKSHTHLWVALLTHRATDALLDNQDGKTTEPALLDADTMLGYPQVGCYVCEEPYEPRLRHRRCNGEPR